MGALVGALRIEIRERLDGVDPADWDALGCDRGACLEHAFLSGLEQTGCVGPQTSWEPRHVLVWRDERLVGALPLYLKADSQGEFIFDHAWADAASRAGLPYYPKLVAGAPFSPVGGRRLLCLDPTDEAVLSALLEGARQVAEQVPATGVHLLFISEHEAQFLEGRGLAIRHTHQFHWRNEGYQNFEDFLAGFRSKRRNQIRRERRVVREAGVTVRIVEGSQITAADMDHAWRFYLSTVQKFYWGAQYLNRAFFDHLHAHFRDRMLLVLAELDGEVVAGTLNFRKGDTLYGRYWGCDVAVRNLHFEICSYAGIEACIERGIQRFEAGAGGGGHKWGRGFLPTVTRSAHEIYLPALDKAVRRFVKMEKEGLALGLEGAKGRVLK